jgi:hypothetical protein
MKSSSTRGLAKAETSVMVVLTIKILMIVVYILESITEPVRSIVSTVALLERPDTS